MWGRKILKDHLVAVQAIPPSYLLSENILLLMPPHNSVVVVLVVMQVGWFISMGVELPMVL